MHTTATVTTCTNSATIALAVNPFTTIISGEIKMADIVTGTITGALDTSTLQQEHSDIRREQEQIGSDIRRETAKEANGLQLENMKGFDRVNADVLRSAWAGVDATKDARYAIADRIAATSAADTAQGTAFYISAQKNATDAATALASLTTLTSANTAAISREVASNSDRVATANALEAAKNAAATSLEAAKNAAATIVGQLQLTGVVRDEGDKTRALINDLKYHDLNRALVERNAELVEEREGRRHWRDTAGQNQFGAQFAQLQSMMQNFNSQLSDTRQGMVNLGTMTGTTQSAATNNIK
jgi:hypothetical protein